MRKHILYLASGNGRRFGSNKLMYHYRGKPLFLHGLETLMECGVPVTVVSRYPEIREAAEGLGLNAVNSPMSERGISHTIRAGLQSLPEVDYILFAVADQPNLSAASVQSLLKLAEEGAECASLRWQDTPGNPTLFSAALIPELLQLEGDRGGRAVLNRHSCVYVEAQSPEELADIDFPTDL